MSYNTLTGTHTLTVQLATETTGAGGGVERSWATVDSIACRIQPMKQEQRYKFSQAGVEATHVAFLQSAPSTRYDGTYRFKYGTRVMQFRGLTNTDESARTPLEVWKLILFEDSRDQ